VANVPPGATDALDVGCGEGWLARELHKKVAHVVGIDTDEPSVLTARARGSNEGTEYVVGDFLTYGFTPNNFDLIVAVASLHHMDEETALRRMAQLLRPGGLLAIVGLAKSHSVIDLASDVGGMFATRAHKLVKPSWETPAPKVWPPPHTYHEVRRLSAGVLPGRRFRRRAMFRYVLTWTKPSEK
jgi:2-polyprenyl-3-methyl-5-hydroxy-6-metoxy-1,4-benzoquinol methylase